MAAVVARRRAKVTLVTCYLATWLVGLALTRRRQQSVEEAVGASRGRSIMTSRSFFAGALASAVSSHRVLLSQRALLKASSCLTALPALVLLAFALGTTASAETIGPFTGILGTAGANVSGGKNCASKRQKRDRRISGGDVDFHRTDLNLTLDRDPASMLAGAKPSIERRVRARA